MASNKKCTSNISTKILQQDSYTHTRTYNMQAQTDIHSLVLTRGM